MADNLGFTDQLTDWQSRQLLAAGFTKKVSGITIKSGKSLVAGTPLGRITATGKYYIYNPSLSDGTQNLAGILAEDVDATSEDKPGTMYVEGEFNEAKVSDALVFAGVTGLDLMSLSGLDTHGIFNQGNIILREEI